MKGVFIIMDGVADEPSPLLQGKTPLEAARTPHLDELATHSSIGQCYTVGKGIAPESSSAVLSLFGNDPAYSPRGPFEALGSGIPFKNGDVAFRCNFGTVDDLEVGNVLDSRAGRTLTTGEARALARSINREVKLAYPFKFYATREHRGVLVLKGGFSDNISNADPFYGGGVAKHRHQPPMVFSESLDGEDDSTLTAELVNHFIRQSHAVLRRHKINYRRVRKGLLPANVILCRDGGNEIPRLAKLPGTWMALGYNPLEIGISNSLKMDLYTFRYPPVRTLDIYSNLHKGLKKATKYATKMLKKYHQSYDYFYIHFKETDIPGHDNRPRDKVRMIEYLDTHFFSFLQTFIGTRKLVITADHVTACRKKCHTGGAVPVLIYPASRNTIHRFTESVAGRGNIYSGRTLLSKTLFR